MTQYLPTHSLRWGVWLGCVGLFTTLARVSTAQLPPPFPPAPSDPVVFAPAPKSLADSLTAAGVGTSIEEIQGFLKKRMDVRGDDEQVNRLVADLAADDFQQREDATQRLLTLPLANSPALTKALQSKDPEQAWRAKRVLEGLQSQEDQTLLLALQYANLKRFKLGVPLLMRLYDHTLSRRIKTEVVVVLQNTVDAADQPEIETLLEHSDSYIRKIAQNFLTNWAIKAGKTPQLKGSFAAVQVSPGPVSGGGGKLIDGWGFMPHADLIVTHLGLYDHSEDGFKMPHEIAIWNSADESAPVSATKLVAGKELELLGTVRYTPVKEITLKAGTAYAIVAHFPETGDNTVSLRNPVGLTLDFGPHLEVRGRRFSFPHEGMAFPKRETKDKSNAVIGPSFRYRVEK